MKTAAHEPVRTQWFWVATWAASLALHAGIVVAILSHAHRTNAPLEALAMNDVRAENAAAIAIDLPGFHDGTIATDEKVNPLGDPITARGGDPIPRLDTGSYGRGGQRDVTNAAVHLSDRDDSMRLSPDLLSRLDRDQQQRLRTSHDRAAIEDRRATTNPMELTFVVTGRGDREERRLPNASDPDRGAMISPTASMHGGEIGANENVVGDEGARVHEGAANTGTRASEPGLGVRDGRTGTDHRASASVMRARPDVTEGAVTIPAARKGRVRDDVESEQEVATAVRSLVHASTAGGAATGIGVGGSSGGGAPGEGGESGAGSHPRPMGDGQGDLFDINTNDPRLVPYFRRLHAKVYPLTANAFPTSAKLDLKQGTVIFEFTIDADGRATVAWPPIRPSGIDEYDRNCLEALKKAMPFEPLPKELGKASIRVRAPFEGTRTW